MTAVDRGTAIDTSMGFTPQKGCLWGTRSGSIDPTIIPYLMKTEHMSAQDVEDLLNKRSGFLGVSGLSNDSRNICDAAAEGNPRAQLALNILYNEIKKYIGSYVAEMNGIDALVFTAGIGENDHELRRTSAGIWISSASRSTKRKTPPCRGAAKRISAHRVPACIRW